MDSVVTVYHEIMNASMDAIDQYKNKKFVEDGLKVPYSVARQCLCRYGLAYDILFRDGRSPRNFVQPLPITENATSSAISTLEFFRTKIEEGHSMFTPQQRELWIPKIEEVMKSLTHTPSAESVAPSPGY